MKQIKKLSLSNVATKLTRKEMGHIMAGSGNGSGDCCATATTISQTGGTEREEICGMTKEDAIRWASTDLNGQGEWCCN